jgi:hypothetical protein
VKNEIEAVLAPLVGLRLWGPARAANMLSIQLGPPRAAPTTRAPDRRVGEFAIHVFCPWRLTRGTEIVVGSGDLLTPADPEADPEDFDWDEVGATWWDVGMREVFDDARVDLYVESVRVDLVGGFALACSGGFTLEVFPNSAPAAHVETEFWRVFQPGTPGPHFVVDTTGWHRDSDA